MRESESLILVRIASRLTETQIRYAKHRQRTIMSKETVLRNKQWHLVDIGNTDREDRSMDRKQLSKGLDRTDGTSPVSLRTLDSSGKPRKRFSSSTIAIASKILHRILVEKVGNSKQRIIIL